MSGSRRTFLMLLAVFALAWGAVVWRHPGSAPFEVAIEPSGSDCRLELDTGRGLNPIQSWATRAGEAVAANPVKIAGLSLKRIRLQCAAGPPGESPPKLTIRWEDDGTPPLTAMGPSWDSDSAGLSLPAPRRSTPFLRAAQILAALLVTALCACVLWARSNLTSSWLAFSSVALAVFGIWLAAFWPGYFDYDSFAIRYAAHHYLTDSWFSYLVPLYVLAADFLVPGYGGPSLIQWLLFAWGGGYVFAAAWNRGASRPAILALFALFVLAPFNAVNVLFNSRDGIFSLLAVAMALTLPLGTHWWKDSVPTWRGLLGVAVLTTLTAAMRPEARIFLIAVPLAFYLSGVWGVRTLRRFAPWLALAGTIGLFVLPAVLNAETVQTYVLSTWVGPLGHILAVPHRTPDPETQKAIEKVFDVSKLKELDTPYEIPAFHQGHYNPRPSDDDLRDLQHAYWKMVAANPGAFLENRVAMFRAQLGVGPGTYFYENGLVHAQTFNHQSMALLGLWPAELWPRLGKWLDDTEAYFMASEDLSPLRVALGSNVLPLLVCLGLLVLYRRAPATACASAILLTRLPLLFFFAPASHFKYGYSYYLFAPLAVAAFLLESSMRSKTRVEVTG